MLPQGHGDRPQLLDAIGIDTAPRVDEWSNEPRPNSPLVIGEISCAQIAEILWLKVRVTRRERTQSVWRQQLIVHYINNGLPSLRIKYRMRQRDREQLIRPNRGIVTVFAVHDIEQRAAALVPEACVERFANLVGASTVAFGAFFITALAAPFFHQAQSVIPEGIDLNCFAAPRCDDQIADLRVHPCQLISLGALNKQSIGRIDSDAEASAAFVKIDDLLETRKQALECVAVSARLDVALRGMEKPKGCIGGVIEPLTLSLR